MPELEPSASVPAENRKAADAKYNRSPKGRDRYERYRCSTKGILNDERCYRARAARLFAYRVWELRSGKFGIANMSAPRLTRREKLERMAAQTASPFEAEIARQMLAASDA